MHEEYDSVRDRITPTQIPQTPVRDIKLDPRPSRNVKFPKRFDDFVVRREYISVNECVDVSARLMSVRDKKSDGNDYVKSNIE